MRRVALDLGVKETSFCEISRGLVIARRTVGELNHLEDVLGPGSRRAMVAIEAWYVHDVLKQWGHEVVLVDTTRTKRIEIRHHGEKPTVSTQSYSREQSSRVGSPSRTFCPPRAESFAMSLASAGHSWKPGRGPHDSRRARRDYRVHLHQRSFDEVAGG
jgi:hypothetical protein